MIFNGNDDFSTMMVSAKLQSFPPSEIWYRGSACLNIHGESNWISFKISMIGGEKFSTCKSSINCSPASGSSSRCLLRRIKHFRRLCNQLYPMRLKLKFNKTVLGGCRGEFSAKITFLSDEDPLSRPSQDSRLRSHVELCYFFAPSPARQHQRYTRMLEKIRKLNFN